MEKSYAKLVKEIHCQPVPDAIDRANRSLRRHSPRNAICSWCENDDKSRFQVTKIDANGLVTEIRCKRCNKASFVCHSQCYCERYSATGCVEYSYKHEMRKAAIQQYSKSILTCNVLEATVTVLLSQGTDGRIVCRSNSCNMPINEPRQIIVTGVDRLGFITGIQCPNCHNEIAFSPLEESYVVQMLYHGQLDQADVIGRAKNRQFEGNIHELCTFLRRHSFYDVMCPEIRNDDQESCRVIGTDGQTGKVNEVEFIAPNYNQNLMITCRSDCYYVKYPDARSVFETKYKEKVTQHLEAERQANKPHSRKAILSCTVLAGTAAILRRHNIDNTLCQNCKNDDPGFLEVKEVDDRCFITSVQCVRPNCGQTQRADQSTACHRSPFYYELIDETVSLNRGDHISWHRGYLIWHHGIVTRADDESVTFAEYTEATTEYSTIQDLYGDKGCGRIGGADKNRACHLKLKETTQRRRDLSAAAYCSGTPYRITYEDSYTNEYAALRAERSLDEEQYRVLNRNCEHVSYWCKTGLRGSDQVVTLSRSVWKTVFAYGLRILNMALLIAFQMIHEEREGNQKDAKAFERFERMIIYTYMSIVSLLFWIWSVYTEHNKLKPDVVSYHCCCNRPVCVVCGLYIRISARELLALVGPILVIFLEDEICPEAAKWKRMAVISAVFLIVSVVSYVAGAFVGILLEYCSMRCSIYLRKSCIRRDSPPAGDIQMQPHYDDRDIASLPENEEQ